MTTDPYSLVITEPTGWAARDPALLDNLTAWTTLPRTSAAVVGTLQRPSLDQLRGALRISRRVTALNARWLLTLPSTARRGSVRDAVNAYTMAVANSSAGGRALATLVHGIRPGAPDEHETRPIIAPAMRPHDVEGALGPEVRARLVDVDPLPMATGDYDQVHRARLDDGRPVAVVVSRPGTARQIREDASLLAPWLVGAEFVDRSPWQAGLVETLRELVAAAHRRCDQRAGALDAAVLQSVLERSGIDDVAVARPVAGLVGQGHAVYELPGDEPLRPPSPAELLGAGMSAVVEAGLVHGVYATHMDRRFVWSDGGGGALLVGGTTLARLSGRSRRAIVDLLGGAGHPVEALVGLGLAPSFIDRDAVQHLLEAEDLTDPMTVLRPDVGDRLRRVARELVGHHGVRPTPELTGFALALTRVAIGLRSAEANIDAAAVAMRALPRLAGIGARMTAA